MNRPFIMEASTPAIAANVIRGPTDIRGLQNRTDRTLRVEELRFRLTDMYAFAHASIRMRIGNEPITAEFTPLAAMAWPIGDVAAENGDTWSTMYVVRFSKPVYLAPGEMISFQFLHNANAELGNIALVVTAICRDAGVKSGRGFLPWFAFYAAPDRVDGADNYEDASTEADLSNPFDAPIFVERFIGRFFTGAAGRLEPDQLTSPTYQYEMNFDAIRVRIEDGEGVQIVRDPTPFGIVFDFLRRSWQVDAVLKAKGYYRVTVESRLNPSVAGAAWTVRRIIGLLGYREVK